LRPLRLARRIGPFPSCRRGRSPAPSWPSAQRARGAEIARFSLIWHKGRTKRRTGAPITRIFADPDPYMPVVRTVLRAFENGENTNGKNRRFDRRGRRPRGGAHLRSG